MKRGEEAIKAANLVNENGKEASVERTQRLFHVTCTGEKNSLEVVMYASNPEWAKAGTVREGRLDGNEIIVM